MRRLFVLLFALLMTAGLKAQTSDNPVIFEINGKKIYKSEFMKEFLRSVGKDPKAAPTACTYEKRQALEEYVELFVNYRTKLEDAYALGYDKNPDLVEELKGYRKELAVPYLIDSVTLDNIMQEAYERNHYTLSAIHLLVRVKSSATADDTLKAYEKAMSYYNRIVGGEDFVAVAQEALEARFNEEHIPPDDPRRQDKGLLGNFSVFDMVYPFETAVFSLNVGEVSKPVRSTYGYHIVKLIDKSPYFGRCTFQHIWIAERATAGQAEARARQAYEKILNGERFNAVCRDYSDDQSTAESGGMLNDMAPRQLPPEYVHMLSRMRPGELSAPFQSTYGWHILMLLNRDSLASYEDMVPYYKQRLTRDSRSVKPRAAFVEQCKQKYGFKDFTKTYIKPAAKKGAKGKQALVPLATLDESLAAVNKRVFDKMWQYSDTMVTDFRPLFSIADKEYNNADFLKYIERTQKSENRMDLSFFIDKKYDEFVSDMVLEYADSQLETEHPEFKELVNEYRNGLMIFSYNDKMIWSKSMQDTVGLDAFYKTYSAERDINNEADVPYFWNERARLKVVSVADSANLNPKKAVKLVKNGVKKGWSMTRLSNEIIAAVKDSNAIVNFEENTVEREHQNLLKENQWKKGVYDEPDFHGYKIIVVDEVMPPALKTRAEARGYYVNEYQNYLERKLIEQLRKKYNVVIHQDVIDEITY